MEAVLDVEALRSGRLEKRLPVAGEVAALRDDADERRVRVEADRVVDRRDDRHAELRLTRALRVEDRDDRLAPVPHDPPHRLAVVGVVRVLLSEDQVSLLARLAGVGSRRARPGSAAASARWRPGAFRARVAHTVPSGSEPPAGTQAREMTPSPGVSDGSCTPSRNSTPGHGSSAISRLPSRSTWSQRLAMCAPAAMPSPDSIMQPSITPRPSARAACVMRTASRIPPDLASLMLIPCARSAHLATSAR